MSISTFKDRTGDTINVEDDLGDGINLEVFDRYARGGAAGGEFAVATLDADTAEGIAKALLGAVGKSVVDVRDLKQASAVSFNEAVLRVAAIHKRTVEFRYAKDKGDYIEARRLNPTSVADSGLYVDGEDPDREAPRRYRLDRIKGEVHFA